METITGFEDVNENSEHTRVCNDEKECEEVEKFYTSEEKWDMLQALESTSPELVCEKFSVKLDSLKQWKEDSNIIQRELMKNQKNLLLDSSDESDSLLHLSVWEKKDKIIQDFERLSKKRFYQKYSIDAYLIHTLILYKIQTKETTENISIDSLYKKRRLHDGFFDFDIKDSLSLIFDIPKLTNEYTPWEWTLLEMEIEKAQKLVNDLYDWFWQTQQRGIFIAEFMLRSKANRIARKLSYDKFLGTIEWLEVWYKLLNINERTINKFAEYFDRNSLFRNNYIDDHPSQEFMSEDENEIKEEIDNVEEDLYFWYDENIKFRKFISDMEVCDRAEQVCIALNDRPFFPDILWLFGWKRKYQIPCVELEWNIFKSNKTQLRQSKNVMKHHKPSKKLDEFSGDEQFSTFTLFDQENQVNR